MADEQENRPENGRARILLDDRMLRLLIQVAPDIHIRGIYWDPAWAGWHIHLEGPGLPPCEEGVMAERLEAEARWHQVAPHQSVVGYDYFVKDKPIAHIGWDRDAWPIEEGAADGD